MSDSSPSTRGFMVVAAGCGLLLVLSLCASLGFGAYYFLSSRDLLVGPPLGPQSPDGPGIPLPGMPPTTGKPPFDPPPSVPPTDAPGLLVVAKIDQVTGAAPVAVGAECSFRVHRVDRPDGTFWCNAQIACSGRLLYGGPNTGFFQCTLSDGPIRHVTGRDQDTTSVDQDPAMGLDTQQRVLDLRDDAAGAYGAYSLRATVTRTE